MIVEWFLSLVAGLWGWLGGLLPDWEVPASITDPGGVIETILNAATGAGVWVDWVYLGVVGLIPLGVWLVGMGWKAFRTAWSHVPLIGGSG